MRSSEPSSPERAYLCALRLLTARDYTVARLREKLGPDVGQFVETVRGVGYRFVGRPPGTEAESGERP